MHEKLRNIAIIAHVDHGKTTLIDKLLHQSGTLESRADLGERMMDRNDLERERGITILAKNTAIKWQDYRINIVDTPGHADFGGEVERVLSMVDSVLLLVDAVDGPMPQTRFVTQKAFAQGLNPIVVVNKVDRPGARPDWVVDQVFDLFDSLGATDEQLDFPIIYASALEGYAMMDLNAPATDMSALLQLIIDKVPAPDVNAEGAFQMQITTLDYSSYVGAIGVGRVERGTAKKGMTVAIIDSDGEQRKGRIVQLYSYLGLDRIDAEMVEAGDIVALAGIEGIGISDTICSPEQVEALVPLVVDEPTVSMTFQVNNSPFAGRSGKYITSRQLRDRLQRELIHNVALRVKDAGDPDKFSVFGRGELHLSILIETMRREGYELAVSRPEVVIKEIDGVKMEPYENLIVDIEGTHQGKIMEQLGERRGDLQNMVPDAGGRVRLDYTIPTRGLIGFHTEFLTLTSGTGIMHHVFSEYAPLKSGRVAPRKNGVLISNGQVASLAYALFNLQERGRMLIDPQTDTYEGMLVGIHSRDNDLVVNVGKAKQLTNIRAAGTDENIILTPPVKMTLEQALEFIEEDELVEVTPDAIRLRKKFLKEHERKRAGRS